MRILLRQNELLEAHDVITAIDVHRFAGYAARQIRCKEKCRTTHFDLFDIAVKWRALCMRLEHIAQSANTAGGKRLDRPGGDGIDTYIQLAQIRCQIADRSFKSSLGYSHHVV